MVIWVKNKFCLIEHNMHLSIERRPDEDAELDLNFGSNSQQVISKKKSKGGDNRNKVVKIERKNNKHRNQEKTK